MINYKDLANAFIDNKCEVDGIESTIETLIYFGLSKEDLIFLNFEEDSIENALEGNKELQEALKNNK